MIYQNIVALLFPKQDLKILFPPTAQEVAIVFGLANIYTGAFIYKRTLILTTFWFI